MPFPNRDERTGDERRLRLEFAIMLMLSGVAFVAGVREVWVTLSGLF